MARTTSAEVIQIMDNTQVSSPVIDAVIDSANRLVTDVFNGDTNLSTDQLADIEKWLTAHMIAASIERTATEEKIGDVSIKYTGTFGKYLDATPYGQMVKMLDTTGKIGNVGKKGINVIAVKSFDE